jgi:hypothetical protein
VPRVIVTLNVYDPAGVLPAAGPLAVVLTVKTELKSAVEVLVREAGLKDAMAPVGSPEALSEIVQDGTVVLPPYPTVTL